MASRSRSRPLKRFRDRCRECEGVYIRSQDSAFGFGYCISVECRCSLYRKLDRRQQLLKGRHGRTHVFRTPVKNTQEPHHGLPQSARCQTSHATTKDETLLDIQRRKTPRPEAENISAESLIDKYYVLKEELHQSESEKDMIEKEEVSKAVEKEIGIAYATALGVLPKAMPGKGNQT